MRSLFSVPGGPQNADVPLPLKAVVDRVSLEGRYDDTDYQQPLATPPPVCPSALRRHRRLTAPARRPQVSRQPDPARPRPPQITFATTSHRIFFSP
jgi:hypothetical protein